MPPEELANTVRKNADRQRPESQWNIERLLNWTADHFSGLGILTPRLDAEVLLAHALGKTRLDLYRHYTDMVGEVERTAYRDLVRRRCRLEPVAYITGTREFF